MIEIRSLVLMKIQIIVLDLETFTESMKVTVFRFYESRLKDNYTDLSKVKVSLYLKRLNSVYNIFLTV